MTAREGTFLARIGEHGVDETGPNKLATFICAYQLTAQLGGPEPIDVAGEAMSITGYHYLEKTDGSINTFTIDALKAAFGWDGRDPFWLQDADFSDVVVQVVIEAEEYQGKARLKVRYVNPEGGGPGGVSKADDTTRRRLSGKLGSKLRALAGGAPAPAPKPVTDKPPVPPRSDKEVATAAAKKAPKSAPTRAPARPTMTRDEAWAAFCEGLEDKPEDHVAKEWNRILAEQFPGKTDEQLVPEDWGWMGTEGRAKYVPF